jgi:hypothetical protein
MYSRYACHKPRKCETLGPVVKDIRQYKASLVCSHAQSVFSASASASATAAAVAAGPPAAAPGHAAGAPAARQVHCWAGTSQAPLAPSDLEVPCTQAVPLPPPERLLPERELWPADVARLSAQAQRRLTGSS